MRDYETYCVDLLLGDPGPLPEITCTHLLNLPYALFTSLDPQNDLLHHSSLELKILDLPGEYGACLPWCQRLKQVHELNSTIAVKIFRLTYDEWEYRKCPNADEARSTMGQVTPQLCSCLGQYLCWGFAELPGWPHGSARDECHLAHLGDGSARLRHEGACLHLEFLAIRGMVEVEAAKATKFAIHCFHGCSRFDEICELYLK